MTEKQKKEKPISPFVAMIKDGETIKVNPLCVDDHKRLGWQVVEEVTNAADESS